jgi:PAS domain-containing protein
MPDIDYEAVFRALPAPTTLLSPDLVILDVNDDFLVVVGRQREEVVGRYVFEAFPENPRDPHEIGPRNLRASLETVLATGARDAMDLVRYDIELPGKPGVFEERYWAIVNTPVLGPDGEVVLIANKAEEATSTVRQILKAQPSGQ